MTGFPKETRFLSFCGSCLMVISQPTPKFLTFLHRQFGDFFSLDALAPPFGNLYLDHKLA